MKTSLMGFLFLAGLFTTLDAAGASDNGGFPWKAFVLGICGVVLLMIPVFWKIKEREQNDDQGEKNMTEITFGKILQTQAENAERARDDMRCDLGRQLVRKLDAKGANVQEIHRRTGLTLPQISRLLVGHAARPDDARLEDLFTLLTEYDLRIELKEAE